MSFKKLVKRSMIYFHKICFCFTKVTIFFLKYSDILKCIHKFSLYSPKKCLNIFFSHFLNFFRTYFNFSKLLHFAYLNLLSKTQLGLRMKNIEHLKDHWDLIIRIFIHQDMEWKIKLLMLKLDFHLYMQMNV